MMKKSKTELKISLKDMQPRYPKRRPIAIDFFSGAGGMTLGFEQAGFDIVGSFDRDPYHVATHERNFPYGRSFCHSIETLTGAEVRQLVDVDGDIDLVFGGPPCQGFSYMGLRDSNDPRNTLIDEFVRIIGELRPKTFVMENVPGMQSGDTKEIFLRAISRLRALGYTITEPVRTLNAKYFGVPQNRERLFVIGARSELDLIITYPEGTPAGQAKRPTVEEALSDLPHFKHHDIFPKTDNLAYNQKPASRNHYARVARGIEIDPSDASRPRLWDRSTCSGCQRTKHRPDVSDLYAATLPGSFVPGHKLPRLDPRGIAPTLRAGSESERGSHTAPRPIHPFEPRCITVREAARLHGYPDWFTFYPAKWHAYRQIGNSVCPPVSKAIGVQIVQALGCRLTVTPPPVVELRDEFVLPEEHPRQHRRIVQLDEFPKVVEHLFDSMYDRKRKRLREHEFSFRDIAKAYVATEANMPRVKPERFVLDIARSRNAKKIIGMPLKHGFTIVPTPAGGRFVPVGSTLGIHEKLELTIRSSDLQSAFDLNLVRVEEDLGSGCATLALEHPAVSGHLWKEQGVLLRLERDFFGIGSGRQQKFVLIRNGRNWRTGIAILAEGHAVPSKPRLARLLKDAGTDVGVLVTQLTREHLLIMRFEPMDDSVQEISRKTYRILSKSLLDGGMSSRGGSNHENQDRRSG